MSARRQSPEPAKEPGTCCFSINPLPLHTAMLELTSLEEIKNKYVLYLPARGAEGKVSPGSPQRDWRGLFQQGWHSLAVLLPPSPAPAARLSWVSAGTSPAHSCGCFQA